MPNAPMLYRELPPTANLARVAACFWEFSAGQDVPPGHIHSIPVDGCVTIAYAQMHGGPKAVFAGPGLEPRRVPVSPGDRLWGVRFKPGASRSVIGKTGQDLRNGSGLLDFILPSLASDLRQQMSKAESLEDAACIFSSILQPSEPCPITQAGVRAIVDSQGSVKIAELPGQAGVSERQFLRVFRAEVGLTPKQLARIFRLRAAAIEILKSPMSRWGEIAAEFGYTDQAHLTHEFNKLLGVTPSEFEHGFLPNIEHRSVEFR